MNINSKNHRKSYFSYETNAWISFIAMRRMLLWWLIAKGKEIILWIRVCRNRPMNINSKNGRKRCFSFETKALMLWFHKQSFTFKYFLRLKFISQLGQTQIHIVIFFLLMIRHHKFILFIGINVIDALVSLEKLFFPPLFITKVHFLIRTNMNAHCNLLSFHDWAT